MTDGLGGQEPPELTPEEEAEVSRLLAEAGGPVAVPDHVVARLDATLADLVQAERDTAVAPVVPLATRRRWPRVLLAAAAVVVGGYAVGTAVTGGSFSGDSASSGAADSAAGGASEERATDQDALPAPDGAGAGEDADGGAASEPEERELSATRMTAAAFSLRPDRLEEDVQRILDRSSSRRGLLSSADTASTSVRCGPPSLERGDSWAPVRYDGTRAVLVTGPASDGEVPATVYGCDGTLLDETVVDAPS